MTLKEVQIGKDELEVLAQMGLEAIAARLDYNPPGINMILKKLGTMTLSPGEIAQIKKEIQGRVERAERNQNLSRP